MGFRILLIVVLNKDAASIHSDYGVTPTNEFEEAPESPVLGAALSGGRYLLYVNDVILPQDHVFEKLSLNASLVTCYVNETTMDSCATFWRNGKKQWCAWHDSQQSPRHLETTGQLPAEFPSIREKLEIQQRDSVGTDYIFDIPVELFVACGGIRYDEDPPSDDGAPWQVLVRKKTKKKWWPFG